MKKYTTQNIRIPQTESIQKPQNIDHLKYGPNHSIAILS